MKKLRNNQFSMILFLLLAAVFFVVYSFISFNRNLNSLKETKGDEGLVSLSKQSAELMEIKLKGAVDALDSLSLLIGKFSQIQSEAVMEVLKEAASLNGFDRIGIANTEGETKMTNGRQANIFNRSFFRSCIEGNTVISDLVASIEGDGMVFFVAVPIQSENLVRGVLFAVLNTTKLSEELTMSEEYSSYYVHIVDQNGNYVVRSFNPNSLAVEQNLFEDFAQAKITDGQSIAELQQSFHEDEKGFVEYQAQNEERKAYFAPFGINDWIIFTVQRKADVAAHYQDISRIALFLSIRSSMALFVVFLAVLLMSRRTAVQLKRGNEELRASEESFRIALNETDNAVFLYDIKTKTMIFKNALMIFSGHGLVIENVPESLIEKKIIYPESAESFRRLFEEIQKDRKKSTCVIKAQVEGYSYIWERITLTNIFNDKNEIIRTVGVIEDVTEERNQESERQQEARYREALSRNNLFTVDFNVDRNEIVSFVQSAEEMKKQLPQKNQFEEMRDYAISYWIDPKYQKQVRQVLDLSYLKRLIETGQNEFRIEARYYDQEEAYWIELIGYLVREKGELHCILYCRDIDETKKFKYQSERDPLTGLYNRTAAESRINEWLRMNPKTLSVFMLLDLDHFKEINDNLGHTFGDQVLADVASKIKRNFRSDDIVVRLGGDEFVVFLKNIPDQNFASRAAGQLNWLIRSSYTNEEKTVPVSCSIGVVMGPEYGCTFSELYEKADIALYRTKRSGRNNFGFYREEDEDS